MNSIFQVDDYYRKCRQLDLANSVILAMALPYAEKAINDRTLPQKLDLFNILSTQFKSISDDFLKGESKAIQALADPSNWVKTGDKKLPYKVKDSVMNKFHDAASKNLGSGMAKSIEKDLNNAISNMYKTAKAFEETRLKLPKVDMNIRDTRTIDQLGKLNNFWIGDNYNKTIAKDINRITTDAINKGLGSKETASLLKENFGNRFKVQDGYWDVLATSVVSTSRNYAQVNQYRIIGVKTYEVNTVGDRRVCPNCQNMDGRIFRTESAGNIVDEVVGSGDPDLIKEAHKWISWSPTKEQSYWRDAAGNHNYLPTGRAPSDTKIYEDAGIVLPPFHGRCRCTTNITEEQVKEFVDRGVREPPTAAKGRSLRHINNIPKDKLNQIKQDFMACSLGKASTVPLVTGGTKAADFKKLAPNEWKQLKNDYLNSILE